MVKIWCEWDMGFSGAINDYDSVYGTMEEALADLETRNWKMVDYNTWQEVEEDGLLSIERINDKKTNKYSIIKSSESGNYEYRGFVYTPEFREDLLSTLSLDLIKLIDNAYERDMLKYIISDRELNVSLEDKTIKVIKIKG